MNTEQQEKLSALLDDYHSGEVDNETLDGLLGDVNQRYTLRRYQMIGDTLRHNMPEKIQIDFATSVMQKIEQEPALTTAQAETATPPDESTSESSSGWFSWLLRPAAGLAVAAAVAVVTVTVIQQQPDAVDSSAQLASSEDSQQRVERLAQLPVLSSQIRQVSVKSGQSTSQGMSWKLKRNEPALQSRLNDYLINHNEYAGSLNGIIPQARVAGFDAQP